MEYTSRCLKRSCNTDEWEAVLSHRDPLTGKQARSCHTAEAKTQKRAERARYELIYFITRANRSPSASPALAS